MAETEEKVDTEKRERPQEAEDVVEGRWCQVGVSPRCLLSSPAPVSPAALFHPSEPPAKQQKISDDSKEDDGKEAEGDEKVAAPVEPKSDIVENDGAAEAKVEETVEPAEPSNDVERAEEPLVAPPPAPVVEDVTEQTTTTSIPSPASAPPSAPTTSIVPSTATELPLGLPPDFSASNPDAPVEERGTVSALYVGRVIGKGGGRSFLNMFSCSFGCTLTVELFSVFRNDPRPSSEEFLSD